MNISRHQHNHYHILQYLVLLLLLVVSFFAFEKSQGVPEKQLQIGSVTVSAYILWGMFHHIYNHDLRMKIVIEYTAVSLLGLGILWSILSLT